MKIFLKKVRLSYPNLFEARSYEGSAAKFSASYLMDPKHPAIPEIQAAIELVAKEKWGAKADAILKQLRAADKTCLRNGDSKGNEEYEGLYYVSASNAKRQTVVDRDGVTPLVDADGKPYAGCYVNAYIEVWAMDNQFGKRVCAALASVQFHSDGEPFTTRSSEPETFESLAGAEENLV